MILRVGPAVPGDISHDGAVDILDVADVSSHFGVCGPQGDVNGRGPVDIFDVAETYKDTGGDSGDRGPIARGWSASGECVVGSLYPAVLSRLETRPLAASVLTM